MSASLESIKAARLAYDEALAHKDECDAAAAKQRSHLAELRQSVSSQREQLIQDRLTGGAAKSDSSTLLDRELDIEAAERSAKSLDSRASDANARVERTFRDWKRTVRDHCEAIEENNIADIDAAISQLRAACARGIAAAKVGNEHGRRFPNSSQTHQWFGAAGRLAFELSQIRWPTHPHQIGHQGFRISGIRQSVGKLEGVEAAAADIRSEMENCR